MNQIKFSHLYPKLLDSHNDCVETATLLQVIPIDLKDLSREFIAYDTDGVYELPPKSEYMMLIFLKPHEHYITDLNLFTTLRRWTPEKYRYYTEQVGKAFNIIIKGEK